MYFSIKLSKFIEVVWSRKKNSISGNTENTPNKYSFFLELQRVIDEHLNAIYIYIENNCVLNSYNFRCD
jgi:hypothetical protein